MANKQLLDAVNEVLKRVNIIDTANTGLLASLTNSALQNFIDVAVQVVNEGMEELYTTAEVELPQQGGESTITLATGTREYALNSGLVKLLWPMVDRTNNQYLAQWMDSYENFLLLDPQQNQSRLPIFGMISPITDMLRIEVSPDAGSNGHVYTYEYLKDISVANATDTVPFNNLVFRAMVPAWVQLWKREMRNEFDQSLYQMSIGRASRALTQEPMREDYSNRGISVNTLPLDPFSK